MFEAKVSQQRPVVTKIPDRELRGNLPSMRANLRSATSENFPRFVHLSLTSSNISVAFLLRIWGGGGE